MLAAFALRPGDAEYLRGAIVAEEAREPGRSELEIRVVAARLAAVFRMAAKLERLALMNARLAAASCANA